MKEVRMGNEESQNAKFDLEDEAFEVTDNWSLHCARSCNGAVCTRSAFVSQPGVSRSPLELLAKNLMVHRHPCIMKYITSWTRNSRFYLITKEVKPLSQVLTNQSSLQICIGLHNILIALIFLHEKALSSHNNVCCSSVYVSPEGVWKLGGLQYLKKVAEVTPSYLQGTRSRRYERAVPPEEDSFTATSKTVSGVAVDQYGFGVLVDELLRKRPGDEIPCLAEFRDLCKKKLQSSDPSQRCSLTEVLAHDFFNHDFIKIHGFLLELPLKPDHEKQQFFRDLTEQLSSLPEAVVASQLASLLLSRIVLLDLTAQQHFLPIVLRPKIVDSDFHNDALFSEATFQTFVVPRLLQMFCVRDAQVRQLLLRHFHLFCHTFSKDELQFQVLPELLVGIKDVNDELVSATLKALSEMVLILGSATVIGGRRGKLFPDGRPKSHSLASSSCRLKPSKGAVREGVGEDGLPERPSPDGGEDNSSSTTMEEVEMDGENWSDWEVPSENKSPDVSSGLLEDSPKRHLESQTTAATAVAAPHLPQTLPDITSLDIKSQIRRTSQPDPELDLFQDMEPVISKASVLRVELNPIKNKFEVEDDLVGADGWDDSFQDWSATDSEVGS